MKYLITGITGFAGPHLANVLFDKGHEIYGLVRGSNGMETDILDIVSDKVFNSIQDFSIFPQPGLPVGFLQSRRHIG